MPPKLAHQLAEQQILKKFEELGYKYEEDSLYISLTKSNREITIYKHNKEYDCTRYNIWKVSTITIQEHQLLHELFKCWGWINEN